MTGFKLHLIIIANLYLFTIFTINDVRLWTTTAVLAVHNLLEQLDWEMSKPPWA